MSVKEETAEARTAAAEDMAARSLPAAGSRFDCLVFFVFVTDYIFLI